MIPEARAYLRSEWPSACGGLSALQRPQPHVRVSGHQSARSLFLTHLPAELRARTARQVSATRAWVANQVLSALPLKTRSLHQRLKSRGFLRLSLRTEVRSPLPWSDAVSGSGQRPPACALGFILSSDANTKHSHLDLELDDLRDSNTECMLRPQMMATIGPSAP